MNSKSVANLRSQGLVNSSYPPAIQATVQRAISSWRQFCDLPRDTKLRFVYADEQRNLDGAGYELKEQQGSTLDLKENFHVTLGAYERLVQLMSGVNADALEFIGAAHAMVEAITPLILEFASSVEKEFGLPGFADEVMASRSAWILRYLHYFGDRLPGDEIASPHPDKSGFTLHLYESAPGLQYLDLGPGREWKEMPVSDGQTVIIPGMQLQLKTGGDLKALCHRVVATATTAVTGRYSMVYFIPFLRTPFYDKSTLGRVQELGLGFNYDLPHKEFKTLFK